MRRRILVALFVVAILMIPGSALAQDGTSEGSLVVGVNSDTYIRADQSVQTLIVINEDAVIDGTVSEAIFVISGTATVNGALTGDVTIISGTLTLNEGASVAKDVVLINSDINQASGATVGGEIQERSFAFYDWQLTALSVVFWIGFTIVVLLAGLLFAAIGGRQLTGAGDTITARPGNVVLAAVIAGIGLPIAAVVAIVTLIGIPVGIATLIFLLPALWFIGYLVAGTKLGTLLLGLRKDRAVTAEHPYLAAFVGLLTLQIVSFVPFIGFLFAGLASFLGIGAVVYYAYRGWRGGGTIEETTQKLTTQPAPAG